MLSQLFFQEHHILKVAVRGEVVYGEEVAEEITEVTSMQPPLSWSNVVNLNGSENV